MKGWHFVGDTLRDGSPVPADGVPLIHEGPVVIRKSGLHGSKRLIDALPYAPGTAICRTDNRRITKPQEDKFVCRERVILWRIDGNELLKRFARQCALDVVHLWDPPDVVMHFLRTGGKADAARAVAYAADAAAAAARTAADAAYADAAAAARAGAAARTAADAAAYDAAYAAYAAAYDAAAAADAAVHAAYAAAAAAARADAAARSADAAAYAAAHAVAYAADAAAYDAIYDAARSKQNRRLTDMVMAEKRRQST